MELYEIESGLGKARSLLKELHNSADIDVKKREIEGLTVKTMDEHFWDDQKKATKIYNELGGMKKVVEAYESLTKSLSDLEELYAYCKEDPEEEEFKATLDEDYAAFEKQLDDF
jgi:peptide chain release factor 2